MSKQSSSASLISWERARTIFGDAPPPRNVWERQFDNFDCELQRLARTPYDEIDFSDLWYYHHDLAYVELQPDLFNYLFPVCLMDWHHSLLESVSCSHGDSEFHFGVYRGNVFEKMLTQEQRQATYEFFRDSFLERLDAERGFLNWRSRRSGCAWMYRFNSLAIVMPRIDMLWNPWWALETPGRAVAVLQYCSGLMYREENYPLFPPCLWEDDSYIHYAGWMIENLDFLRRTLTGDFVKDKVASAVARLRTEPEWQEVRQLEADVLQSMELIRLRIAELPELLGKTGGGLGSSA